MRSVDIIVVIAETRVCQPRHGGSAWVFSHDASGSDCSSKKKRKKKKQEKLLNWPSNKKGGKKVMKSFWGLSAAVAAAALGIACGLWHIRHPVWLRLFLARFAVGNFRLLTRKRDATHSLNCHNLCVCCSLIFRT